jgi:cyclophilin family peptidyl-prolyl cis-trans isomerase
LVRAGFFNDVAFFRVIKGFMAQFGVHGDPKVAAVWKSARIQDDPVNPQVASNTRGKLTFATAGPNTRSSQFFINYSDGNARLDGMGFSPIGEVIGGLKARVQGMTVVDNLYNGYGEGAPRGKGPAQGRLQSEGNAYLKAEFPEMDYIKSVTIQSESDTPPTPAASAKPAAAAPVDSALLKTATALKDRMCACKDRACIAEISKDANSLNVGYVTATPAEKTAMRKLGMEMGLCIRKFGPPPGAP